jgi:hypothetical protein
MLNQQPAAAGPTSSLPNGILLGIAVAQALLLFALYRAFDAQVWPSQSPLWFYPLCTAIVVAPEFALLALEHDNTRAVLRHTAAFTGLLLLLAVYTGWQAEPYGEVGDASLGWVFTVSIAIACFKALMYLQQRAAGLPLSYPILFTYSWRNFLVLALAGVFVLGVYLVLLLWGALFSVIGIDFFQTLFRRDWFLFPILGLAHGLGIIIFRDLHKVIDSITRLLEGLLRLLLPLVVCLSAVFLLALPFTGLEVLWATGNGTALLLWLTAAILFATNAVYQDGRGDDPYPRSVHRLVYLGLCTLPVLSALSCYGLLLRIQQYGWSVERFWGALVWLILAAFSIGYAGGILRRRADWPQVLARVNTAMGLGVLALLLLANSPLLDFRKLSLNSQLARVESGAISWREFDFYYVAAQLARPGYLALESLKDELGDSDPELLAMIETPQPRQQAMMLQIRPDFWDEITLRPAGMLPTAELKQAIENHPIATHPAASILIQTDLGADANNDYPLISHLLIQTDLDADAENDYVLISYRGNAIVNAAWFYRHEAGWQARRVEMSHYFQARHNLRALLQTGVIETREPALKDLAIGDILLRPALR